MVTKKKHVRSSLREKKRYLVYEWLTEKPLNATAVKEELKQKMLTFLGEYGYGAAGIMFLDQKNNRGMLRVNTKYLDHAKAALMLVQQVNATLVTVKSVGVSGMREKATTRYLERRD